MKIRKVPDTWRLELELHAVNGAGPTLWEGHPIIFRNSHTLLRITMFKPKTQRKLPGVFRLYRTVFGKPSWVTTPNTFVTLSWLTDRGTYHSTSVGKMK